MFESPPIIMVDTNVWLDIYLPHRPGRQSALELLRLACNYDAAIVFPAQSVLDVYWQVMADNKRWARESNRLTEELAVAAKRLAWECVHEMREIGTAIPVDSSDLYLADKFRDTHDDLEDDLVMAACQRSKANYLVTRDRKLLGRAPIDARTPKQMIELLRRGLASGTPMQGDAKDESYWLLRWLGDEG